MYLLVCTFWRGSRAIELTRFTWSLPHDLDLWPHDLENLIISSPNGYLPVGLCKVWWKLLLNSDLYGWEQIGINKHTNSTSQHEISASSNIYRTLRAEPVKTRLNTSTNHASRLKKSLEFFSVCITHLKIVTHRKPDKLKGRHRQDSHKNELNELLELARKLSYHTLTPPLPAFSNSV